MLVVYNTARPQFKQASQRKSTALPYHNHSILQIRGQRMPTLIPIPGDIPQRNHIRSTSNVADYAVITQSETSAQTNTKTSRPSKSGSNSSQDSEQVLPTDLLDENPSLVKLPSQLQNLLHVYKFIRPDLNLKNSIKPVPQASNCELRGSGPDELNAPYKVNGQAFNIYDFYAKRHEIADAIEMSITAFSSWYENLRFSDALHLGLAEDNLYQWRFKVIFISKAPTTCEGKSSPPSLKYSWALKMAGDFYKSIFNRNKDDAKSIDYALLHSPSIMIVAAQCKGNTPLHFHTLKGGHHRKAARVVACMTYDTGEPEVNSDELPPILILWLAVSDDTQHAPIAFDKTWRRQGFALFLLIHAIKSCCVLKPTQNADTKTPCAVNVYLQCTQSAAYHFYLSCGFGQINKGNDDGRMSLNTSLQKLKISTQKAHANITTNPSIIPKVKKATVAMSRKKPPVLPTTRNRIDDVVLGSAGKTPTLLERILTPPTKRQRVLDKRHAQDGDTIASLTQPLMVPSATKQDSNPVKKQVPNYIHDKQSSKNDTICSISRFIK
jgi:hypothetical protein